MQYELSKGQFLNIKNQILSSVDASKKGNIDEPVKSLIDFINGHEEYVTTSSCSGRVIVVDKEVGVKKKEDCKWLYTNHDPIRDSDEFVNSILLKDASSHVIKFEPFILHVLCRTLASAKILQTCALQCGLRNSGLTIGRKGKLTLAIRSTLNLEFPASKDGTVLINKDYLCFIVDVVNSKFKQNFELISLFETSVKVLLQSEQGISLSDENSVD